MPFSDRLPGTPLIRPVWPKPLPALGDTGDDARDGFAEDGRLLEEQVLDVPCDHCQTVLEVRLHLAVVGKASVDAGLTAGS